MRLRSFARRRQGLLTVLGSLITAAILVLLLAGRRDEFVTALSSAAAWVLLVTVLLQVVALVSRSEAWHLTIGAAGGEVDRRTLYRASSMQVLGSVINVGAAAAVLILGSDGVPRRPRPVCSPRSPARSAVSALPPGPAPIICALPS